MGAEFVYLVKKGARKFEVLVDVALRKGRDSGAGFGRLFAFGLGFGVLLEHWEHVVFDNVSSQLWGNLLVLLLDV